MSDLLDLVVDYFPPSGQEGVPVKADITITLSGTDYDEDSLLEGFFIEGPDYDQYIGPGLQELRPTYDENLDLTDFFESPGYQGLFPGETTVSGEAGNTKVIFTPSIPMQFGVEYRANLTGVEDASGTAIDGFVSWTFVSGSGSIEEIPATVSTSILSAAIAESAVTDSSPLTVSDSTPGDRSVNADTNLEEIVIEFSKPIDPNSVTGKVAVKAEPCTDHPLASTTPERDLYFATEVEGNKLKIKL